MFLDKVATVYRESPTASDNDKEAYATIYPSIRINIQPASAELVAVAEGVYGQTSLGFVSVSGIQIGDRVTVSGTGDSYIVRGINDWNYLPIPHCEIVMFKADK